MSMTETGSNNSAPAHAAGHDHDATPEELRRALGRRTPAWKPVAVFAALLLVGAGVVAAGIIPAAERKREVAETGRRLAAASRRVQMAAVRVSPAKHTISLPAGLQPDMQADVLAQATGYVASRKVDIGDRVRAGDVLAEIDIPLVEQDLARAKAAQGEAEAELARVEKNLDLARTTLERWRSIQHTKAVAQQDVDERQAAYDALVAAAESARATIESRRADVRRVEREKSFGRVVAPFDGVITARQTEVGDYVVGTGGAKAALFSLAKLDTLRVFVDVPQAYAYSVKVGQRVSVAIRELSGREVSGTVTRTAGSLDDKTRTLRTEIQVPNADGGLLAGTYATVRVEVVDATPSVIVPGSALIVRAEGPRVAVVDEKGRLSYVPVKVGRDLGTEVEITGGLEDAKLVVVNLFNDLPAGTVVEPVMPKP